MAAFAKSGDPPEVVGARGWGAGRRSAAPPAVVAYASDMSIIDSVLKPHEVRWEDGKNMVVSLDHCMWFHRPFRADQWLLLDQDSPNAYGARGLARGLIFDEEGHLVVSLVQEGLVRVRTQDPPPGEP